jgi:hypothetical protein
MAEVGRLFLQWGFLENELRIRRGDLSSLTARPDLQEPRRIRNLIAHGVIRASVDPRERGYLCCRGNDDAVTKITFDELRDATMFRRTHASTTSDQEGN